VQRKEQTTVTVRDSRLPPTARRWVKSVIAFGVAAPVGLAPWLGKAHVPLFSALLETIPPELQKNLISFSAFLMGMVAAAVQFYSGDSISRKSLRKRFLAAFIATLGGLLALIAMESYVIKVPFGHHEEVFVIGWSRLPPEQGCLCPPDVSACIKGIASHLDTCWSKPSQDQVKLTFELSYLLAMGGFGALIGILVLRQEVVGQEGEPRAPPEKARRKTRTPSPQPGKRKVRRRPSRPPGEG
jgi:hypothetical protein